MQERTQDSLGVIGYGAMFFFVIAVGLVQLVAAWFGWADLIGWGWTILLLGFVFMMRFTLLMTIGAFLCALNVWDWHWVFALLFAAPGLILMVPGMLLGVYETIRGR